MSWRDSMATNSDEVDWETIGRDQLERTATRTADNVETAIRLLGGAIARGTADPSDLTDARQAIEGAIYVLEDDLAPAVPGDTGRGDTRYIHSDGTAVDYLSITTGQATEARHGATVELDSETIRKLADGHSVETETPAGIDVELQPETEADP